MYSYNEKSDKIHIVRPASMGGRRIIGSKISISRAFYNGANSDDGSFLRLVDVRFLKLKK